MAQAMASMTGLQLEGSSLHHISGSSRLNLVGNNSSSRVSVTRPAGFAIRAQQLNAEPETSRRAVLGLVAVGLASGSFVQAVLAEAKPIKVGPAPAPFGGLPGTENADEARDLDLPLKNRFFLQPLTPAQAAARAKESAKEIVAVKQFIDKKAWPFVQNDLRLRSSYLRYDLKTILSAKPKEEKEPFKNLTGKLFKDLDNLDHAAKIKSTPQAEKYYAETVSTLNDVVAKLG